jgi:hypothetical protein
MATGNIYKVFLANILNPDYGFGFDLPYYVGNLKVELLSPSHTHCVGATPTAFVSEIVVAETNRVKVSPISTGSLTATWNNITGLARYVRVYDAITPTLAAGDPYLCEIDFGADLFLDNDTLTVFFNSGFINFEGNLI